MVVGTEGNQSQRQNRESKLLEGTRGAYKHWETDHQLDGYNISSVGHLCAWGTGMQIGWMSTCLGEQKDRSG